MAASAPWTWSSEVMAPPVRGTGAAQTVSQSLPYTPSPNMISWVQGSGIVSRFLRVAPFGNASNGWNNVVDPGDLQVATNWSYSGGVGTSAACISARKYIVSNQGSPPYQSRYIWTSQNYPGTSAVAGGPAAYAWDMQSAMTTLFSSSANNVNFLGNNNATGPYTDWACEFVSASAHGFKTGQVVTFDGNAPAIPCYVNAVSGTTVNISLAYYSGVVYVTSATTFAMTGFSSALSGSNTLISNAVGTTPANWLATAPVPSGGCALPYEVLANIVASVPNAGMWVHIPTMATDATITQIATTIFSILPVGRQVYPEYQDEHWNSAYTQASINWPLGTLCSLGSVQISGWSADGYYAFRQYQIHNIFESVRSGAVVRAFGSAFAGTAYTEVTWANAYNATSPSIPVKMDAVTVSLYPDETQADIPLVCAAASTYSNYPSSLAYKSATPLTLGMLHDMLRHWIRYQGGQYSITGTVDGWARIRASTPKPRISACRPVSPYRRRSGATRRPRSA